MAKLVDLLVLITLAVIACGASLLFRLDFLASTLLFLAAPSLYLVLRLRTQRPWKRIAAMALLFGGVYGFAFAYIADWNKAWAWPEASLPFGYWFGILNPVEWVWVFLWVILIILFYEHFLERDTDERISPRFVWALAPAFVILAALAVFTLYLPSALDWPYAYACLALLALPPAVIFLIWRPRVIPKIALVSLFFIPLHFAHEVVGLWLNQWMFPGQYFWLVPLPGGVTVPIEEFTIWILLGSAVVLCYYELYVDDGA